MGRGDDGDGASACVVYGTPLENELEMGHRRRAKALEKGTLRRQQPAWQQEVRDTEGRRRFHGAFTGGFSAGYYNTVGSKEGWEPKTFKSSRSNRANKLDSSAYDYMDEDERTEMDDKQLGTSHDFDTFGFTATEYARRQALEETKTRPSVIPGPVPDELIVPASTSIGIKLLMKMGWRHGRGIGPKHIAASSESLREGRKAMMALASAPSTNDADVSALAEEPEPEEPVELPSSTPAFVLNPKKNVYGLGFDPYQNAPEFRDRRAHKDQDKVVVSKGANPSMFRPNAGMMSRGFGIGALEDMGEEDEDVYASGPRPDIHTLDEDEPLMQKQPLSDSSTPSTSSSGGHVLPGFKSATEATVQAEWFSPPNVPTDYVAVHKFTTALTSGNQSEAPPEASPPDDKVLVKLIEGLASLVAKSGLQLEVLNKERNKENPQFQFLFGGTGSAYYTRKLWEERMKHGTQPMVPRKEPKMNAGERGKILGENQLQRSVLASIPSEDRARLQATLQSSFMTPAKEVNDTKLRPYENDPAKQARFEQFMKDKYQGGLRKTDPSAQKMSEVERAQELLEFENVANGVRPTARPKVEASPAVAKPVPGFEKFMSAGQEHAGSSVKQQQVQAAPTASYPRRTEISWYPAPLLCKRFELPDPHYGKAAPKAKSRTDSLTLSTGSESLFSAKVTEALKEGHETLQGIHIEDPKPNEHQAEIEEDKQEEVERIQEKPVDLYKAIFSDDEDEPEAETVPIPSVNPGKQVDAANAALNRLVADDFLESLGKELGLRVPPPAPVVRASNPAAETKGEDTRHEAEETSSLGDRRQEKEEASSSREQEPTASKSRQQEPNGTSTAEVSVDEKQSRKAEEKRRDSDKKSRGRKKDKVKRRKRDESPDNSKRRKKREKREKHSSRSKRRRSRSSSPSSPSD